VGKGKRGERGEKKGGKKEKGRREEAEREMIRCYVALLQWIEYGGVYSG
jgi:hypothetical protein